MFLKRRVFKEKLLGFIKADLRHETDGSMCFETVELDTTMDFRFFRFGVTFIEEIGAISREFNSLKFKNILEPPKY